MFLINLQGILAALDSLLSKGWKPIRSFYVGFGHDEEVSDLVKNVGVWIF